MQCALFVATEEVGEALVQKLLAEKCLNAELEADGRKTRVPESKTFLRGMFAATEFAKKLLVEDGFTDDKAHAEMTTDLSKITSEEAHEPVVFPDDIEVKPIDLNDSKCQPAVKLAYGSNPLSSEAWKIHYTQQLRFAPELSFVAWNDVDEPVAAIMVERIVDGEGGGVDKSQTMHDTSEGLQKQQQQPDADTTSELSAASSPSALEFLVDFKARKERITQ